MLFSKSWTLYHGATFLKDSVQLIWVCYIVDKTWNKQNFVKLTISNNSNLPIAPTVCVCVCVCIKGMYLFWESYIFQCMNKTIIKLCIYIYIYIKRERESFFPTISWESKWCNYTVVLTWPQLDKKSPFHFITEIRFPHDWQPVNYSLCLSSVYVDIAFSWWDIATEVYKLVCKASS